MPDPRMPQESLDLAVLEISIAGKGCGPHGGDLNPIVCERLARAAYAPLRAAFLEEALDALREDAAALKAQNELQAWGGVLGAIDKLEAKLRG